METSKLTQLRGKLGDKTQRQRLLSTGTDTCSLQSVGQVAKQGMVDLPRWLVEGFVECGWTWGGAAWGSGGNFDAMHFEYPHKFAGCKA